MTYWKFGGGYSYRTPGSKKTGWSKTLAGVPKTAKTSATKKKRKTSSPKKNVKRRSKKTMAKKRKSRRSSFKLPGGVGPKGILMGVLGLSVIPQLIPVQSRGAQKLATGLALRALKVGGGGALSAVGLMELAAEYAAPVLGGFGISPNGNGAIRAVYDY